MILAIDASILVYQLFLNGCPPAIKYDVSLDLRERSGGIERHANQAITEMATEQRRAANGTD
jgi:hypothetical protein